jgi:hypothetical protein
LYWVDKEDPRGPAPKNPSADPQFNLWNPSVLAWWEKNKAMYGVTTESDLPNEYDTVHTGTDGTIIFSGLPSKMDVDETKTITLSVESEHPLTKVDIFINDNFLITLSSPFRFSFNPQEFGYTTGKYIMKAVGTDTIFGRYTGSKKVEFIK